jgi:threonine/homoserine/homoserine lactone efflux protein
VDLNFFLRGFAVGFAIAAPVGPIGVLCIRRTLADGRASGLLSGLGAATADALYGCVAAFGITAVSDALTSHEHWLRLVGGLFLCFLGVRTFLRQPADAANVSAKGLAGAFVSTLLLTLTNPTTILSFAFVFAGLGPAAGAHHYGAPAALVLGVFAGSALWWLLLSFGVALFRHHFDHHRMRWVNRISGIVIALFGVLVLVTGPRSDSRKAAATSLLSMGR